MTDFPGLIVIEGGMNLMQERATKGTKAVDLPQRRSGGEADILAVELRRNG